MTYRQKFIISVVIAIGLASWLLSQAGAVSSGDMSAVPLMIVLLVVGLVSAVSYYLYSRRNDQEAVRSLIR